MTDPLEPAIEMLWEVDAPDVALIDRFGFADAGGAGRWVAATVAGLWGMPVDSCDRIVMSDHNALAWIRSGSESYIVKWSVIPELFARLSVLAKVTLWLEGRGNPVSAPVAALDGRLQVEVSGVSVGLQRQIPGALLDVSDEHHVRAAGAQLARLHVSLADYPFVDELPPAANTGRQLKERISGWLDSDYSANAPTEARERLRRLIATASSEHLKAQMVHGDFRSANVLVTDDRVAAILDFEEARLEFPVVELAQSAVLLGTQYRNWGPVSSKVHDGLLAGYQAERPLLDAELQWWNALVLWISLMFIPPGEDPTGWAAAASALASRS